MTRASPNMKDVVRHRVGYKTYIEHGAHYRCDILYFEFRILPNAHTTFLGLPAALFEAASVVEAIGQNWTGNRQF
eukprot:COSAG01_NODE_10560_length_2132_cov_129.550910_2_plen_75_part_00